MPPAPTIIVRNERFASASGPWARWWHSSDPVPTAFFNALSSTFPVGETFFMDSVRPWRRSVPAELAAEIGAFLGQEAVHKREHAAMNGLAEGAGYKIAPLEARSAARLEVARARGPVAMLAATAALEHFTAILSHALLARGGRDLDGAPEAARRLWLWHAREEIEHKAVAFDVLTHATRGLSGWQRWRLRSRIMILASLHFVTTLIRNLADLYRQDGLHGPRIWARTGWYLLGRPGVLRRIAPAWARWFRPGFHPWEVDDRGLLG